MTHIYKLDPLEPRTLLSAPPTAPLLITDPGNSTATALSLGSLSGTRTLTDSIPTDPDDYYKLTLKNRGNFNLKLSGLQANADLQILSSHGDILDNATAAGTSSEQISRSLDRGTYFIRVFQSDPSVNTTYSLRLTADLNYGIVRLGTERREVGLVFANGSTRPIQSNRITWIIIHGWLSTPDDISRLSSAIDAHSSRDQVLVADWSTAAADPDILGAISWVPAVAQFAANTLARWGISGAHINIVGHSLGGYMANELADDTHGGVNRILALDPATPDLPGLFISGVDYAAHSRFSVGFIGSDFSTPEAAATADETFHVRVGDPSSIFTHANVVDLVASVFAANNTANPDPISRLFALEQLTPTATQPFKPNAYAGGFEGTITGQFSSGHWVPRSLTYKNRKTGKAVTIKA